MHQCIIYIYFPLSGTCAGFFEGTRRPSSWGEGKVLNRSHHKSTPSSCQPRWKRGAEKSFVLPPQRMKVSRCSSSRKEGKGGGRVGECKVERGRVECGVRDWGSVFLASIYSPCPHFHPGKRGWWKKKERNNKKVIWRGSSSWGKKIKKEQNKRAVELLQQEAKYGKRSRQVQWKVLFFHMYLLSFCVCRAIFFFALVCSRNAVVVVV